MATLTQTNKCLEALKLYKKKYIKKQFSDLDESATRIMINSFLTEQLKNIVTILKNECIMYNNIDINTLQKNAQAFYTEFARRHNHNVRKVFSPQLANWILN
jgi:spore germination protein YaaH